jgi:hypothetical protein
MNIDFTLLKEILIWIVTGGGAGTLAFFLIDRVPVLARLGSERKRYVSLALAAILAMGATIGAIALGYTPQPGDVKGWIETLFAVAFVAVSASQVIHGRVSLRRRRYHTW